MSSPPHSSTVLSRPITLPLPSSPTLDRRRERFPSTHLQEDFVRIHNGSWTDQNDSSQGDSLCASFLSALYPTRLIKLFTRIPPKWRYLIICLFFVFLLILSAVIVIVIINASSHPYYQPPTQTPDIPPPIRKGDINEISEFLVKVNSSLVHSLSPDPFRKKRYLAFDSSHTLTVIVKNADRIIISSFRVIGLPPECVEWKILSIDHITNEDEVNASQLVWCCIHKTNVSCANQNSSTLQVSGKLVYSTMEADGLHITIQSKEGNVCTLQHHILSQSNTQSLSPTDCSWKSENVQWSQATIDTNNRFYYKASLLEDNDLVIGKAFSSNYSYHIPSFARDSFAADPPISLVLSPPIGNDTNIMMVGTVSDSSRSQQIDVARVRKRTLSRVLVNFNMQGDSSSSSKLQGYFFDSNGDFTLWYTREEYIWIVYFTFGWNDTVRNEDGREL